MIKGSATVTGSCIRPICVLILGMALMTLVGPATALAAPQLQVTSAHEPPISPVPEGTYAFYEVVISNTGDDPTAGEITVDFTVPAGLQITAVTPEEVMDTDVWACSISDSQSASCTGPTIPGFGTASIAPGTEACVSEFGAACRIRITLKANPGAAPGSYPPTITACGGGNTVCPAIADTAPDDPIEVVPFDFHVTEFDGEILDGDGDTEMRAGARPHVLSTEIFISTFLAANGEQLGTEQLRDTIVELPPGLLGNPQAYPTCTTAQIAKDFLYWGAACPPESKVGEATIWINGPLGIGPDNPDPETVGIYNITPPFGVPALFAFNYLGKVIYIYGEVRTGDDYGVTVIAKNAAETLDLAGVSVEFWGVPGDPAHDARRCVSESGTFFACSSTAEKRPFLSLPTSCTGPLETSLMVTGWLGSEATSSFLFHEAGEPLNPIGLERCEDLQFSPTLEARPTTDAGDAPSGFGVSLKIPQNEGPCVPSPSPPPELDCGRATAHLKDTTVTLPEGLVVNPSSANGLGACSEEQFGFTGRQDGVIHTTPAPATCPDSSKLGTVEVHTPLLDHPVQGAVYLAEPHANPFGSLLALYISIDNPQTSVVVKLAGKVHADPASGRLSATFEQNPQLPFEEFELHFFGGDRGALRTPAICGNHTTSSSMTPWSAPASGPPATPGDTWTISRSCSGSPGEQPHAPSLAAGTVSPIANTYSPFVVRLRREDGSQNFSNVTINPPPGLLAKLAGTEICSDAALDVAAAKSGVAEKVNPSCPTGSKLGSVVAGAGAGPAPYYAPGIAYLAGPYKGAPLSLAIVTPATAGPFDLGTIVVRVAAHIDPRTARITAVSDSIPSILQGIPLDVRTIDLSLDRPEFTKNPTSCDPMVVEGSLISTLSQTAFLASRFQADRCRRLRFKPRLFLRLFGKRFGRGANPRLRAVLQAREGQASIARSVVAMPRSLFLDQGNIRTVCTRVEFAADRCPPGSIYGRAVAFSPLVDYALRGNVYLRSSDNELPDLVADLRGPAHQPIRIEVVGRTDSVKGALRSSFDVLPDAPVSKFVLNLQGGRKSLLVASQDLCDRAQRASVRMTAHNGKNLRQRRAINIPQCKKAGGRSRRR